MKAAVLHRFGSTLSIETVPEPAIGTGEVLVDVFAAPVLSYTNEVLSGERKYAINLPMIPGCGAIGRIRSVGPDATQLTAGDWVICDPTVRSRDNAVTPDITLQGWSARGEGGLRLQNYFHDGPFAEQIRIPTENAIRIGPIENDAASQWCALSTLLVPYGGLRAVGLQAGETILVSGATGNFGSCAVATALAMGAGCVVAPGRNEAMLEELVRRFGSRVRTVRLSGDQEDDRKSMVQASPGPIDCVLDILPPRASAIAARAAIMTVRPYGRVVLMGGVGMAGGPDLELPYSWIMRNLITIHGQWMYELSLVTDMVKLVQAGRLNLDEFAVTKFNLTDANEAVAHAAANNRPFHLTVIHPQKG